MIIVFFSLPALHYMSFLRESQERTFLEPLPLSGSWVGSLRGGQDLSENCRFLVSELAGLAGWDVRDTCGKPARREFRGHLSANKLPTEGSR